MASNIHKRLLQSGLGSLPPKMPSTGVRRGQVGHKKDYSPLEWSQYFAKKERLETSEGNTFNVYSTDDIQTEGEVPPVLLLLHGGGFSGLTWSLFAKDVVSKVRCRVIAPDLRGHGDTLTQDENSLDIQTMARDVVDIWRKLVSDDSPQIILIGHSMGGALAVHSALLGEVDNLVGLIVIDVVEGTAMDALTSMQSFLKSRPSRFKSLSFAIEWSVRSGQVRNAESARVSMPGQLKSIETHKCAIHHTVELTEEKMEESRDAKEDRSTNPNVIREETEEGMEDEKLMVKPEPPKTESISKGFTWRIDLSSTESHWPGWFSGLSEKFLSVPASKMLLLAGVDRLDKELTVGQMQGKFQMQVLPQAGHAVHEDVPDKVADVVATFLVRNKFAQPKDSFQRTFPAC